MINPRLWACAFLLALAVMPTAGRAQSAYVSDEFEITLRSGPAGDRTSARRQGGLGAQPLPHPARAQRPGARAAPKGA